MKRFTDAGRRAIADGNLYAGLGLALMLPDICASLEDPGPGKSRARYIRWCKQWVEPRFPMKSVTGQPYLDAEDCYELRCSLIHSGSAEIEPGKQRVVTKFEFFDSTAGSHMNLVHDLMPHNGVKIPNFIQLKVDLFSEELFKAADDWDLACAADATIQAEKAHLLVVRSAGFSIGVVTFG